MRAPPQRERDRFWIEIALAPPLPLVARSVQLVVMAAAERHGEFVADLAAERA